MNSERLLKASLQLATAITIAYFNCKIIRDLVNNSSPAESVDYKFGATGVSLNLNRNSPSVQKDATWKI